MTYATMKSATKLRPLLRHKPSQNPRVVYTLLDDGMAAVDALMRNSCRREGLLGGVGAVSGTDLHHGNMASGRGRARRLWSGHERLAVRALINSKLELYPESRDSFFTLSDSGVAFSRDSLDRARSVLLAGQVQGSVNRSPSRPRHTRSTLV